MVGTRIKAARKAEGWSQETTASRLGCSVKTVSRYELGQSMPTLVGFAMLCEVFSVPADVLLARDAFVPRQPPVHSLSRLARRIVRGLPNTPHRVLVAMRSVQGLRG